jgi:hypothetical protein
MTKFAVPFTVTMLAAGFAVSGCFASGPYGSGSTPTCTGMPDSFSCTSEACDSMTMCIVEVPHDDRCGAGRYCRPSDPARDANGCVGTPPPATCSTSCDDSVACTVDFCDGTTCRHVADSTACTSGVCDAHSGCVGGGMMPPPTTTEGFHCVWTNSANRIGYAVRVRATGMHDVRTIPDSTGATMAMSGSHIRLWALGTGAAVDDDASGWATYSLIATPGGRINTHPFIGMWRIGPDPAFNRDILNIANLQADGALTAHDLGIEAQVCLNVSGCSHDSDWVNLPEQFYVIDVDTVDTRFWDDPAISSSLRGQQVLRAVLFTNGNDSSATCHPVSP